MVALARACQQYGRFREARQLLEAAGAHGELLALCVFQGDFPGLQEHARQVRRGPQGTCACKLLLRARNAAQMLPLSTHRRGATWSGWRTSWWR